jgi:nicotinic acid mononucleotide adenylyltransferase
MKKIVFTFGRMNPPTIGHQKLVDKVNTVAKTNSAEARVYLSHTQNNKKDPLSYKDKIRFAKKAFGNSIIQSESKTVFDVAKELQKAGYTDAIMVVGSDRVKEFQTLLNKYNGKDFTFDSVKVVSAGERDPDAQGVEGMSASKLRALAKDGDFDTFKSGLPKKLQGSDAKIIYDIINSVIKESVEENRQPLTIQQRKEIGRRMKRLAPKLARMRKLKAKRKADGDTIKKRALKQARNIIRTKVAGDRGASYNELSSAEKVSVDKMITKKSAIIQKLAKKLIPKVRKQEAERLAQVRSGPKEEQFDPLIEELFLIMEKDEKEAPKKTDQDSDVKDLPGTQPKKYYKGLSDKEKESRAKQFAKGADKPDGSPSSYKSAPGDADAKTKPSKHTLKYKKMFGEQDAVKAAQDKIKREKESDKRKHDAMLDRARTKDTQTTNTQTEEYELSEDATNALKKKSEKSGIPVSVLRQVYNRGMAAWKTGHRPGATQQQWGFARVNSFITKGKGTWGGADKDLAKGVKEERDYKKEYENYQGKPEQIARRSSRNQARRIMGDKAVKGKDVGHKDNNPLNNDPKNLRMEDPSKNRREPRLREEIELDEKCWDGYKQVGMKKKGDKMVPDCVPEAISPAQQAAIAISKKERGEKPKNEDDFKPHMMYNPETGESELAKVPADHERLSKQGWTHEKPKKNLKAMLGVPNARPVVPMGEEALEEMPRWLLEPLSKITHKKGYDMAKKVLADVLDRKKKEGGKKGLQHSIEYYAAQIAKQFDGVDARVLADMMNEESCCNDCDSHFDHIIEEITIVEEDGKKKNVKLNNPFRTPDGPKKFSVYVKNEKGNVVKVNFGDPNMEIKRDDPARRKSFRARHGCDDPGPKWKARYWSCYQWRASAKVDN